MADQKKSITLLPGYLQSDTIRKVFSATVDHLFQQSDIEFLNGYIGYKPTWYDRTKDVYITELDKPRTDYQLTPTPVSVNYLSGQITNSMFYDDLLSQLRFQGADVSNPDRLFSAEYYSWAPPIDIDKFVNFGSYFWLPGGPNSILLLDITDLYNVNGLSTYTYTGSYQLSSTGQVFSGTLTFSNGLKITPTNDRTLAYNNKEFYIEGVGQGIVFVPNEADQNTAWDIFAWDTDSWDGNNALLNKQYVTISRGSVDGNIWSVQNRWFHQSVVTISQTYIADKYSVQAFRPIIEFDKGMVLYRYGTHSRGNVDVCDINTSDIFGSIVGQSSYSIQNIQLQDGMRILVTADIHANINNKIYIVSGVENGSIQLTLDTSGRDVNGLPIIGDRVLIKYGASELEGKNSYFDGNKWVITGQQKTLSNPPLFLLYDVHGNAMDDPSVYPRSNFVGSKVFSYQTSNNSQTDVELGMPINLDQFGDYIFDNNLSIDSIEYVLDNKFMTYTGELFVQNLENTDQSFTNGWWKSQDSSRQYIVNNYLLPQAVSQFQIDQPPAVRNANSLPTIIVKKIVSGNEIFLIENIDYVVNGRLVSLTTPAQAGDRIIIKTWNTGTVENLTGYYEVPKNLSANPNNLPVTSVSRSQVLQHFIEIIENQYGFLGNGIGVNNYRDSAKNRSFGLSVLQHRAPLLKLALMNSTAFSDITRSTSLTDPMLAMDYAQRSYVSFYNRFVQTLLNLNRSVTLTRANSPDEWIAKTLSIINVGKTTSSPWANSGPTPLPGQYCSLQQTNPTYVPATPTRLGILPSYQPIVYFDNTYLTPKLVLQTHDGSRIVLVDDLGYQLGSILHNQASTTNPSQLTDPVAAAWLQFELNLYNSLPAIYKNTDFTPVYDIRTEAPGRWRKTAYSNVEVINLMRGAFDKWCITNQVDFSANTGYSTDNQFSYNYRSVNDTTGNAIPGHWQGIYRWYYDTDRPHTHPWEMLGFTIKPDWWDSQYGPAPYTSGNTSLWEDLRDGYIRHGRRQGKHELWARPGLMSCIPVDNQGSLLPPFLAGCTRDLPSVSDAQAPWILGDGGPIESVWINSSDYKFSLAEIGYLMNPARFVEYNWDTLRTEEIFSEQTNNQWIYVDTNSRRSSQQFYVHRENPSLLTIGITIPNESDLSYFGSCGFQHWISEYLISGGYSVTNYFGNVIRGGDVKLAHRMAGFTPTDSFRALVDSFGQIGYNSRLIPSENINIHLYKSGSIGESVYSGVIIEQVKTGWKIRGYDNVNPSFFVIPSDKNGNKVNVVIGNQQVTEFSSGLDTVARVLYGTVFTTRQQVYDFLIGYGRWLENQGWLFRSYDGLSNTINDWSKSAKEFLFWSQGVWDNGTFITVSPSADSVTFGKKYGNIQYVNGIISGTYPVLDRTGQPIQQRDLDVIRDANFITVKAKNDQGVFLLRLFRNTLEHAVYFDNTTAFNDIIYQPEFNLFQERILMYAYRAKDWDGRVNIPGYIITQNTTSNTWAITSNFDKSVDDFTKLFNIEQPTTYQQISPGPDQGKLLTTELGAVDSSSLSSLAKHLIGYQNRAYLQNLLLDDSTEFEFYQGFIRQKGTLSTINSLLRNTSIIPAGSTFQYYEEWLLRTALYGAWDLNQIIEFILPQDKITNSPQQIRLFSQQDSDIPTDYVFDLVPGDPLIVTPPTNYQDPLFTLRDSYAVDPTTDMPTAGYALLGEPTYYVTNQSDLINLYDTLSLTTSPLAIRNTIWQFITTDKSWTVWRVTNALSNVAYTVPSSVTGEPTLIVTTGDHGLIDGDICIIFGITGLPEINGTFVISNVTSNTFSIDLSTFQAGSGGTIWVYRQTRFDDIFDRDSNTPPDGWANGDIAYVDEGGIVANAWTVYKYIENNWVQFRQQEYKINASLILSSELFDSVSKLKLSNVDYFDPAKGRISGKADAEINYKTDYDPALYNNGNNLGYSVNITEAWSSAQLGQVWWDLTTARYIDYDQGDDSYKVSNWGKLAPGTSIDVYEWIRSSIPPSDWANYVAEGTTITVGRTSFIPSGTVRNPESPNWSEFVENNDDGTVSTYYYFWVKNSSMSPMTDVRQLTTQDIANLIVSPSVGDMPWYAAISQRSIIIGNVSKFLNGNDTIQRIRYTNTENNSNNFNEWQILKENDPYSQPDEYVWQKLRASLVTFDGMQNDVPDYHLTSLQKYGNLIRPRQTWFLNRVSASTLFVNTCNSLIAKTTSPLVDDITKINWISYFNAEEPEPDATEWSYHVSDIGQRDALIGAINIGEIVLVDAVSSTNNLWTMWRYNGGTDPWTLIRTQYYKVSKYWKYVDWFASGFSSSSTPTLIVNSILDLELLTNMSVGTLVKVLDNGSNKWQLWVWSGILWVLAGQQDGSIEILPSIYQWDTTFGGFDGTPFDYTPNDLIAGIEFGYIIDGIKNSIFSNPDSVEINVIFFTMLRYVLSEQGQVDWVIKTSNISLRGFNQPLTTSKLLTADLSDSILGFVNEAKPYHVKISELVVGKTSTDYSNVSAIDFDLPPNFSQTQPANDGSLAWYIWNNAYQSWLANYKNNPNLIRTLKTKLIFDRIATPSQRIGWGTIWDQFGFDNEKSEISYGAIDRIDEFYNPSQGMIPKVIADLMIGVDYRSTVLDSVAFNIDVGWSVSAWDSAVGWEPSEQTIKDYINLIIQGGQIPQYDTAIGNGVTTEFMLMYEPRNPLDMVVWADGAIKKYDTEWYVPTHANRAYIVQGGINYQVGDQLDLIAGTGLAPVRLQVTATDHGTITDIIVLGTGSYRTVTRGPYQLQYPVSHPGNGSDALIDIDWDGEKIKFVNPPAASQSPNIYVLYAATTFEPAPTDATDTIYSGSDFVIPHVDAGHPEELYTSRIKDTLMLDTYVSSTGGRPLVTTRVYETDGVVEQFDISIKPETIDAIFVYLNGTLQVEGINNDYVINFVTNRIVFITPPATGLLRITAISAGGASRSANAVYTAKGGYGYNVNDVITFAGGVGTPAQIRLGTVTNISATIDNPGVGYNVSDELTLIGGTLYGDNIISGAFTVKTVTAVSASPKVGGSNYLVNDLIYIDGPGFTSQVVLRVSSVGYGGVINEFEIIDGGVFELNPAPRIALNPSSQVSISGYGAIIDIEWGVFEVDSATNTEYIITPSNPVLTSSIGTGATLNVSYSAGRATIINPGLYTRKPDQPVVQQSISPIGGVGAEWNIEFTKHLNEYIYYGDGNNRDFIVPGVTSSYPGGILVTVAGESTPFTRLTNGIRLVSAPAYGAVVIVNTFTNNQYSLIQETLLEISDPLTLTYELNNRYPQHTMPYYVSTLVRQNGSLLQPPVIDTWFGNGSTREFTIDVDITSGIIISTDVYIDSVKQTPGIDFNIVNNTLLFYFSPSQDCEIVLICIKNDTTYSLSLVGTTTYITFASGVLNANDNITVTTFSEDIDYNFTTEEFIANSTNREFELATIPYDRLAIDVWVAGQYLTPGVDYVIEERTILSGWDFDPWDTVSWALNSNIRMFVVLGDHISPIASSSVVVNYMFGLPERPAVAWRTLQSLNNTESIAIDNARKTTLLSNVYTSSTTIEISDITKVSRPSIKKSQAIYINDELIEFYDIQHAPTYEYPNRGFLTNLIRNANGTSGNPLDRYAVIFYNGNNSEKYFATEAVNEAIAETIWVDEQLQRVGTDYTISINPPGYPAGRYAKFVNAPISGYKNVKIISLNANGFDSNLSHIVNSTVIDAGDYVRLPNGYYWEPAKYGIQYGKSTLSNFLLKHSGTRS